jgi:hypothetical protein
LDYAAEVASAGGMLDPAGEVAGLGGLSEVSAPCVSVDSFCVGELGDDASPILAGFRRAVIGQAPRQGSRVDASTKVGF